MREHWDETGHTIRRLVFATLLSAFFGLIMYLAPGDSGLRGFGGIFGCGLIFILSEKFLKSRNLLGAWRKFMPMIIAATLLFLVLAGMVAAEHYKNILFIGVFVAPAIAMLTMILVAYFRKARNKSQRFRNRLQRYWGAYFMPLPGAFLILLFYAGFPRIWTFLLVAAPIMFASAAFSAALLVEAQDPEPRVMPLSGLVLQLVCALLGSLLFGAKFSLLVPPLVFVGALIAGGIVYAFETPTSKYSRSSALLLPSVLALCAGAYMAIEGLPDGLPRYPAIVVLVSLAGVLAYCARWVERAPSSAPGGQGGGNEGLFYVSIEDDGDDADG